MINDKVLKALNNQINMEFASSYIYLSMAAYFDSMNFKGFAHWMKLQSEEEHSHAIKIFDYIHDRDGKVALQKIDEPKLDWKSPLEAFEDTYNHELEVSKSINEIYELAIKEKDHATNHFLQWFIGEQVEEESTALYYLDKVKLVGDNKNGLFLLDRELGMRAANK